MFIVFGLTRLGIKPESTVSVADALSTRPLIGSCIFFQQPLAIFQQIAKDFACIFFAVKAFTQ